MWNTWGAGTCSVMFIIIVYELGVIEYRDKLMDGSISKFRIKLTWMIHKNCWISKMENGFSALDN